MANIDKVQLEAINTYYEGFIETIKTVIKHTLDNEIEVTQEFMDTIPKEFETFKGTHAICALKCLEGYLGYGLIIVPEEFIATLGDLIMGGSGMDVYKGSLTELEINASAGMFESLFDKIREVFQKKYVKALSFKSNPKFINKGAKGYDEAFTATDFDVSVVYNIKINQTHEFKTFIILNSSELIGSLKNIHLLEEAGPPVEILPTQISLPTPTSQKMGTYDIKKLADIKIDISAELGKAQVSIKQVLSLVKGSILELDAMEGNDISVFANGSEVARAQVVVVDGHFGIKITKILDPQERFKQI